MKNAERAQSAGVQLLRFGYDTNSYNEPLEDQVVDLVTNLGHFLKAAGVLNSTSDFDALLGRALGHFDHEVSE